MVEVEVVCNEDGAVHEPLEVVRDIGEIWRVCDHGGRDAGQPRDARRYRPLWIEQSREPIDDLTVTDLDRADLGNPMMLAAAAGRLHVYDDILLPRVQRPADSKDVGAKPRGPQLLDAQQLVTAQLVSLRLHLDKAGSVRVQHQQVRVTVH